MSDARVTNVASIDDFRVALAEFAVQVRQALTDLEMEIHRAMDWISVDRPAHWRGEVRRSGDLVARAKDELAHSRTFKRMGDFVPSCVEEKKAVDKAKQRLAHAEQKVEAVRHWASASRRAVDEFKGPVQQLMGLLDGDIPRASALLERMSRALAQYTSIGAPTAVKWEDLTGKGDESMAQPVEEVAGDQDQKSADPAADEKRAQVATQ
jgi:hypothetical protein